MSGKIILNLAMSLDGYIADNDGGFQWIVGHGDKVLDTEKQFEFEEFLKGIDIVVMGKKCYDQGFHQDYKNKKVYVATSAELKDEENISFINGDIVGKLQEEKAQGKNIYLFGGGLVIDHFIKADVIDEYIVGIIPTILGGGRPLFLQNNPEIKLHLDEYSIADGVVVMKYSKR